MHLPRISNDSVSGPKKGIKKNEQKFSTLKRYKVLLFYVMQKNIIKGWELKEVIEGP